MSVIDLSSQVSILAAKFALLAALAPGVIDANDLCAPPIIDGNKPLIEPKVPIYGIILLTIEPKKVCRVVGSNGL